MGLHSQDFWSRGTRRPSRNGSVVYPPLLQSHWFNDVSVEKRLSQVSHSVAVQKITQVSLSKDRPLGEENRTLFTQAVCRSVERSA